jgi:glycosyltransferase involved in cell wall biosynthesis
MGRAAINPAERSLASGRPAFLVLDTSYTLEMIRERGMEESVLCRDIDGFFRHVWTVHPFASLLTSDSWTARYGRPVTHALNDRHSFIEGKIGRFAWLARISALNFLVGQALLFVQLLGLIRRERIGAIRAGDPLYLGLFGWGLARLSGVPLVIRINANNDKVRENTGAPIFPRLFRSAAAEKRVERFVLRRADLVAAPNQDNVDFALANGARADAVTIFPYGNLLAPEHLTDPARRRIDPALLERLGVRQGKFLLCVGRIEPVKFPDDAVRMLGAVRAKGHDLDLLMVGSGGMNAALEALAAELGAAGHLKFAGNQNQLALSQLIPAAAAVISPLTGRALSEAAFGAAPIVAYDLDWQGDLIQSGRTGELVPFRDTEAMASALLRLIEDPAYAAAMGSGARERAREMLDPERLNQHERDEYARLFAGKARA